MANVNFFDSFGYQWAQSGDNYAWSDTQWQAGWAAIGSVPPSVSQFNSVQRITDQKLNYVFSALQAMAVKQGFALNSGNSISVANFFSDPTENLRGAPLRASDAEVLNWQATKMMTPRATLIAMSNFGIGGAARPWPHGSLDDSTVPSGLYYSIASISGTFPYENKFNHVLVSREGVGGAGATARQTMFANQDNRIWTRTWTSTAWTPWEQLSLSSETQRDPALTYRGMPVLASGAEAQLGNNATKMMTPATTTLAMQKYGLAGAAANWPTSNINDSSVPSGFYYVSGVPSGTIPPGDDGNGHMIVSREGNGITARQLYLNNNDANIWTRCFIVDTWSSWERIVFGGEVYRNPDLTNRGMPILASEADARALVNDTNMMSAAKVRIAMDMFGIGGGGAALPGGAAGSIDNRSIGDGFYFTSPSNAGTFPNNSPYWGHLMVTRDGGSAAARQTYFRHDEVSVWTRFYANNAWSAWIRFAFVDDVNWAVANSGGKFHNVQVFATSRPYNATPGTKSVIVEVQGGGGGGGGVDASTQPGYGASSGGGGAGGYAKGWLTSGFNGQYVTVGGGGAGGAPGANNGVGGGTSSFGSLMSATPGVGGYGGGSMSASFLSWPANMGTGSGGNIVNFSGKYGMHGISSPAGTTAGQFVGAGGGDSQLGSGGSGGGAGQSAMDGQGYGSGGGGVSSNAISSQSARAGGNGRQGVVIVWEYA